MIFSWSCCSALTFSTDSLLLVSLAWASNFSVSRTASNLELLSRLICVRLSSCSQRFKSLCRGRNFSAGSLFAKRNKDGWFCSKSLCAVFRSCSLVATVCCALVTSFHQLRWACHSFSCSAKRFCSASNVSRSVVSSWICSSDSKLTPSAFAFRWLSDSSLDLKWS